MWQDELRTLRDRNHGNIRVHGNGFIQLDLSPTRRLHVWGHPSIPRQVQQSPVHDHRFDFRSEVVIGRLVNVVYDTYAAAQPTHEIYEPRTRSGEDTELHSIGVQVSLMQTTVNVVQAGRYPYEGGQVYHMQARVFHETFTNIPTITIMDKIASYNEYSPRVLVPIGREPDNDFFRDGFSAVTLWNIVSEVAEL